MPKISESQIKLALAAPRDARSLSSQFAPGYLSGDSGIRANERALGDLLASFLAKTGFDVDAFEKINAQNDIALDRIAKEQKDDAVKRSSSVRDSLRHQVGGRLKTPEALPNGPQYVLLDTPFLIWPTHGLAMDTSHVEPANSFAKVRVDRYGDDDARQELGFYFIFQNPSDRIAVINADAYLVASGFCGVRSDPGMAIGLRQANVHIVAHLHLWEWWNQPPTEPFPQVDQTHDVLRVSCDSSGLFASASSDVKYVFRGYDLRYISFVIPAHDFVVLEVVLSIHYWFAGGSIDADFSSGDCRVMCPAVLLTILN